MNDITSGGQPKKWGLVLNSLRTTVLDKRGGSCLHGCPLPHLMLREHWVDDPHKPHTRETQAPPPPRQTFLRLPNQNLQGTEVSGLAAESGCVFFVCKTRSRKPQGCRSRSLRGQATECFNAWGWPLLSQGRDSALPARITAPCSKEAMLGHSPVDI